MTFLKIYQKYTELIIDLPKTFSKKCQNSELIAVFNFQQFEAVFMQSKDSWIFKIFWNVLSKILNPLYSPNLSPAQWYTTRLFSSVGLWELSV